jgi:hypothetical protein
VALEGGPRSLVSITEELLELKNIGSGTSKQRLTVVGNRCTDHATLSSANLALTLLRNGGRSVSIVRLRTEATELSFSFLVNLTTS